MAFSTQKIINDPRLTTFRLMALRSVALNSRDVKAAREFIAQSIGKPACPAHVYAALMFLRGLNLVARTGDYPARYKTTPLGDAVLSSLSNILRI